jgi:hypothetical protein
MRVNDVTEQIIGAAISAISAISAVTKFNR